VEVGARRQVAPARHHRPGTSPTAAAGIAVWVTETDQRDWRQLIRAALHERKAATADA
jgi:hypothetical protein